MYNFSRKDILWSNLEDEIIVNNGVFCTALLDSKQMMN